jgi:hypothetical protein
MTVTLANLRTRAKQRADMSDSEFIEDAEWLNYINASYAHFYDFLVGKFEDWYVQDPLSFTIADGESTYSLPSDFYKLLGVDRNISGDDYVALRPFSFMDRNKRRSADIHRGIYPHVSYRILGSELRFNPADQASGTYRLWYVPKYTDLSADSDTIDGVNGWEEWIVLDVARKALMKEESDITAVVMELRDLEKRILEMAQNRNVGDTDRIQDVTISGYDDPLFYR